MTEFSIKNKILLLLRFFVQTINHMKKTIGGNHIVEGLATTLCIDIASHVREIAQQVKAIEEDGQVLLGQTLGEASIPDKFIGVHGSFLCVSSRYGDRRVSSLTARIRKAAMRRKSLSLKPSR